MYLIVGLGNPGTEYARTRHNVGRMVADFLTGKVEGVKIVTPDTFMNKTGGAVAKAVKSKKAAQKLIVIHDDMDLPLGTIRISYNRGSGGHKGVESIIQALKTKEFIRLRIGIGSPRSAKAKKSEVVEKHILGEFKKSEMELLTKVFERVEKAIEVIVERGLTQAMTEFNK